jgi:hypothetical protein
VVLVRLAATVTEKRSKYAMEDVMDINQILDLFWMFRTWVSVHVPREWLIVLQGLAALYTGFLLGQFVLVSRLRNDGYDVKVKYDSWLGRRRYFIEANGLENEEEIEDVDEPIYT